MGGDKLHIRAKYILNLTIPKGEKGENGEGAGNVLVGTSNLVSGKTYLFKPSQNNSAEGTFVEYEPPQIDTSTLATKAELSNGLGEKQDVIEDLEEIREGASKGATALQEHQDISGKLDKSEAESIYATKTEFATKQDKNIYYTNVTASEWVEDSTYVDFVYKCDLACEGVTPNDYAEVVFEVAQSTGGDYAPVCETLDNAVRIWSKKDSVIIVPTIIISK